MEVPQVWRLRSDLEAAIAAVVSRVAEGAADPAKSMRPEFCPPRAARSSKVVAATSRQFQCADKKWLAADARQIREISRWGPVS